MLQQTLAQLSVDSQPRFENQALLRLKSLSATHNSGLFHLANGSFGRCCRHLNKKMFKKSLRMEPNYSRASFGGLQKENHQIFKKRPDVVICSFCEAVLLYFYSPAFERGSGCRWLCSLRSFRFRGRDTKREKQRGFFLPQQMPPQLCYKVYTQI